MLWEAERHQIFQAQSWISPAVTKVTATSSLGKIDHAKYGAQTLQQKKLVLTGLGVDGRPKNGASSSTCPP